MMTEAELSKVQMKTQDITQGLPQLEVKPQEQMRSEIQTDGKFKAVVQELPGMGTAVATTPEGGRAIVFVGTPVKKIRRTKLRMVLAPPPPPQSPQKSKRSSGTYIVLTAGNVAQEGGGILPVLVPGHEFSSRVTADKYALEYAQENPGAVVLVHRSLGKVSVQTVSTVKLVRS